MTRNSTLISATVLLGLAYAFFFTDWFRPPRIQISAQPRPYWVPEISIPFRLDGKYLLTEIKVTPLETNQTSRPVWHLVKGPKAEPVSFFLYGQPVDGLQPAKDKPAPDVLQPNSTYRLTVTAGRVRGELDFRTPPLMLE